MEYNYNDGMPTLSIDLNEDTLNLKTFQKMKRPAKERYVESKFETEIIEAVLDYVINDGHLYSSIEHRLTTAVYEVQERAKKQFAFFRLIDTKFDEVTSQIVGWLEDIEIPKRGKDAEFEYQIKWH